jgi:hypothetical protein
MNVTHSVSNYVFKTLHSVYNQIKNIVPHKIVLPRSALDLSTIADSVVPNNLVFSL